MPDDPLKPRTDPEEELRKLFDAIEEDVERMPLVKPTSESSQLDDEAEPLAEETPFSDILSVDDELVEDQAFEELKLHEPEPIETRMPEAPEWSFTRPEIPGQRKPDAGTYLGIGVGLSIAYTMVGATLAGWLIGLLIDKRSGSGALGQAIGTLIGAVIGLAGAILTIIRAQDRSER